MMWYWGCLQTAMSLHQMEFQKTKVKIFWSILMKIKEMNLAFGKSLKFIPLEKQQENLINLITSKMAILFWYKTNKPVSIYLPFLILNRINKMRLHYHKWITWKGKISHIFISKFGLSSKIIIKINIGWIISKLW